MTKVKFVSNLQLFLRFPVLVFAVIGIGSSPSAHLSIAQSSDVSQTLLQVRAWGFDQAGMDRSVSPGNDFYKYANGTWARTAEIPADRVSIGSFPDLRYNANARVQQLLEEQRPGGTSADSSTQKAVVLYHAFMDSQSVEKRGDAVLQVELQHLKQIKSKEEMAASMGFSFSGFGSSLFDLDLSYDDKNPTRYAVHLGQAGLGLPNRDYYLQPQFANAKQAYETYIAELLRLAAVSNAKEQAHAVVEFETQIAEASATHAEVRDPVKAYSPQETAVLVKSSPEFPWHSFFVSAGVGDAPEVIVTTSTSVPRLARIFASTQLETLKTWQAFSIIDAAAPYLPDPYVQAHFRFRSHTLGGQPTLAPRSVRAVAS